MSTETCSCRCLGVSGVLVSVSERHEWVELTHLSVNASLTAQALTCVDSVYFSLAETQTPETAQATPLGSDSGVIASGSSSGSGSGSATGPISGVVGPLEMWTASAPWSDSDPSLEDKRILEDLPHLGPSPGSGSGGSGYVRGVNG